MLCQFKEDVSRLSLVLFPAVWSLQPIRLGPFECSQIANVALSKRADESWLLYLLSASILKKFAQTFYICLIILLCILTKELFVWGANKNCSIFYLSVSHLFIFNSLHWLANCVSFSWSCGKKKNSHVFVRVKSYRWKLNVPKLKIRNSERCWKPVYLEQILT